MANQPELPPFPSADPATASCHLLALPEGVGADEVEALAVSRFLAAGWDAAAAAGRAHSGGRRPRGVAAPRVLRLSRHSRLVGPYAFGPADAARFGLPTSAVTAFVVEAPHERGDPPYPGGDRDGLGRAFSDGMPVRDEERVAHWLVAAARRLGGSVRIAGSGVVLTPPAEAVIDLTVYSDVWLEPTAALAVMKRVMPRARLAMDPVPWAGPPPGTGTREVPGAAGLSDALRKNLHAEADAYDVAALSAPDELTGYGVEAEMGIDGLLVLEAAGEDVVPLVLSALPWAANGAIAYRVRWQAPDFQELELERPSLAHRVARGRALPLVSALTREVHHAVGGEVVDAAEFLVDPADL
ncbi:hypothetical protein [Pengzhenrongella frigida]|uniref:hypothetical protein n=1 Tax=Pengzhenrongella frigida TaxID=1259133 RepID=UPI0013EC526A|nr:hypothetical protein [Cellulomonas sp. HLT2-17]